MKTAKAKPDGKKKKQGKNKDKSKILKCFLCYKHKQRHFKKDCSKRKLRKKWHNGDAAILEVEGYESTEVCIATYSKEKGKWVIDSGCIFHM